MISIAHAQATNAAAQTASPTGAMGQQLIMILVIFGIFYFLIIRPRVKEEKKRRAMLAELKKGDEVITTSGIYGKITELKDDVVMLQIAKDVIVKMERQQIQAPKTEVAETTDKNKK